MATKRIEERKARDRDARRAQIVAAARRISASEGWPSVTVRRLSEEISYSQPVLYSHFENREGIVAAVAIEGFQELGLALEKAKQRGKRSKSIEAAVAAYLNFAAESPSLYEAMFTLGLNVPFGAAATPPELRFAFSQVCDLFLSEGSRAEVLAEVFWASLHGVAELTRTNRLPPAGQKERLRVLAEAFRTGA